MTPVAAWQWAAVTGVAAAAQALVGIASAASRPCFSQWAQSQAPPAEAGGPQPPQLPPHSGEVLNPFLMDTSPDGLESFVPEQQHQQQQHLQRRHPSQPLELLPLQQQQQPPPAPSTPPSAASRRSAQGVVSPRTVRKHSRLKKPQRPAPLVVVDISTPKQQQQQERKGPAGIINNSGDGLGSDAEIDDDDNIDIEFGADDLGATTIRPDNAHNFLDPSESSSIQVQGVGFVPAGRTRPTEGRVFSQAWGPGPGSPSAGAAMLISTSQPPSEAIVIPASQADLAPAADAIAGARDTTTIVPESPPATDGGPPSTQQQRPQPPPTQQHHQLVYSAYPRAHRTKGRLPFRA